MTDGVVREFVSSKQSASCVKDSIVHAGAEYAQESAMTRRTRLLEDVMEIAGRMPWQAGIASAVFLFVALHLIAGIGPSAALGIDDLETSYVRNLIPTFARLLQYVLPLAMLVGALCSFLRKRRGRVLLADATANPGGAIQNLSWQDFERLVAASFEQQGFAVVRTGGVGADGGVDLALTKARETTLVQCKQWRAQKVGVTTIRELYGVMAAKGAAHGVVITTGDFTSDAREFALGRNVALMNGETLASMLRDTNSTEVEALVVAVPECPQCGSRMIRRMAQKGPRAGQPFWGCARFPGCRATLSMS